MRTCHGEVKHSRLYLNTIRFCSPLPHEVLVTVCSSGAPRIPNLAVGCSAISLFRTRSNTCLPPTWLSNVYTVRCQSVSRVRVVCVYGLQERHFSVFMLPIHTLHEPDPTAASSLSSSAWSSLSSSTWSAVLKLSRFACRYCVPFLHPSSASRAQQNSRNLTRSRCSLLRERFRFSWHPRATSAP